MSTPSASETRSSAKYFCMRGMPPAIPITTPTARMIPTDQMRPVSQVLRPSPSSVSVTPCFQPMTIRPAVVMSAALT